MKTDSTDMRAWLADRLRRGQLNAAGVEASSGLTPRRLLDVQRGKARLSDDEVRRVAEAMGVRP